jgi:hypothetical protein
MWELVSTMARSSSWWVRFAQPALWNNGAALRDTFFVPEDEGGNGGGDLEGGGGGGEPPGGGGGGGPGGGGGGESEGGKGGAGVPEKGEARTEGAPKRLNPRPPLSDGPLALPTEAQPPPPLDFAPTVAQPDDFFGPPPSSVRIGAGARGIGGLDEVLVGILMP